MQSFLSTIMTKSFMLFLFMLNICIICGIVFERTFVTASSFAFNRKKDLKQDRIFIFLAENVFAQMLHVHSSGCVLILFQRSLRWFY